MSDQAESRKRKTPAGSEITSNSTFERIQADSNRRFAANNRRIRPSVPTMSDISSSMNGMQVPRLANEKILNFTSVPGITQSSTVARPKFNIPIAPQQPPPEHMHMPAVDNLPPSQFSLLLNLLSLG
jgi:hypothetical protein